MILFNFKKNCVFYDPTLERTERIVGKRPYNKLNCPCSLDNHSIIRNPHELLLFPKHIIDWSCYMISHTRVSVVFCERVYLYYDFLFYNNKYCSRTSKDNHFELYESIKNLYLPQDTVIFLSINMTIYQWIYYSYTKYKKL